MPWVLPDTDYSLVCKYSLSSSLRLPLRPRAYIHQSLATRATTATLSPSQTDSALHSFFLRHPVVFLDLSILATQSCTTAMQLPCKIPARSIKKYAQQQDDNSTPIDPITHQPKYLASIPPTHPHSLHLFFFFFLRFLLRRSPLLFRFLLLLLPCPPLPKTTDPSNLF